jgi:FixJ family two-component response regulator
MTQITATRCAMQDASIPVVAVVDDDRVVLESLVNLLESGGYHARVFSSGKDFLDSDVLGAVGCLIADIRMSGIDGWELAARVRQARPGLPVIFITGHDSTAAQAQLTARELLPGRLFRKPFDGQQLLTAIGLALEVVQRAAATPEGNNE